MSRHHTLPPIVYTPAPPKPKETRRRRNVGSAQGTSAADEADETEESGAPAQPTFTHGAGQAAQGAPPFKAAEHIPPTTGKLSSDTLKTMLEVQEQASAEGGKDKL
ncbi:hypothetical protein UB31_02935 [Bradyrhizobium sp. LTSP849]|uniref:hypothetical protein n=1 Tax=Bradyrhizobium sp. LTSP849 TaxID=1615890 RepID=UPI0005D2AFC6|nr:hypothetical protein [Bradyrhizobium sp. LTSP849]KJC54610.1 hypothetical protein UB31_02935 [Bradyrhizobium sp. LTSP849]